MKTILKALTLGICLIALTSLWIQAGAAGKPVSKNNSGWTRDKLSDNETPGSLKVLGKDGKPAGECPLKHTDVKTEISGFIARVTVTQEFQNPFNDKIEAVYTFPLSQNGAVDDMIMKVGDRTIRGLIKRKEEARRIYDRAKAAGHVASLLDQERPNIFTQSVANIMPGENVTVTISYVEYLKYEDGWYEFNFPMVVGPRYIPGDAGGAQGTGWSPDTNQVPDASKITPPVTPEGTRAGHDISVSVSIDAGVPIRNIESKLHDVAVDRGKSNIARVELKDKSTIPNKDFILRYQVAGSGIDDAVLTHAEKGKRGFFTLILQPPLRATAKNTVAKEMIFVIDSSGSMGGWPIEKAKETMKYCVNHMNPNDTFNLVAFANTPRPLFDKPLLNTPGNREKALRFLAGDLGEGGTEMLSAVHAVLKSAPDPERVRIVSFMTDGYVGNDMQILSEIKKYIGSARFFSFGVGDSVNHFLLDEMARIGRGEVEYVTLEDSGEAAAKRFHERIANPALTDIKIDWNGLRVEDVYPETIPDLFSHKPLVIKGRYPAGAQSGTIRITGRAAGERFVKTLKVNLPADEADHDVLAPLWAREKIAEVMRGDYAGVQNNNPQTKTKELIAELGLEFRLVTQYTSFVAVDESSVTNGSDPRTVAVPVEMPEGVSYDGVFGETEMKVNARAAQGSIGYYGAPGANPPAPSPSVMAYDASASGGGYAAGNMPMKAKVRSYAKKEAVADEEKDDSADKLAAITASVLSPELIGLAEKVTKQGRKGNLKLTGVEIKNWKVKITVQFADLSKEALDQLKKIGFEKLAGKTAANTVVGRIDVRKLEALSLLAGVVSITPSK